MIPADVLQGLEAIVGAGRLVLEQGARARLSRDHAHFSPVLRQQLAGCVADAVVLPATRAQLLGIARLCVHHRVPLTARGAGTGNYGQCVPMHGGLVVGLGDIDKLLAIEGDSARCEPGLRMGKLEESARAAGLEMRFFPSTVATATIGGFLGGGSAGVGSITWGTLWDEGNVREVSLLTMEDEPREVVLRGHVEILQAIHGLGLNGIITEVVMALAPRREWNQVAVAFPALGDALALASRLAHDEAVEKRLVSVTEWPAPSFFAPLAKRGAVREGDALLLLETTLGQSAVEDAARLHHGEVTLFIPASEYRRGLCLSDFTWNHATLWAMKADEGWTYIQDGFDEARMGEQVAARRARWGERLVHHVEYLRSGGVVYPQGMSLVRASTMHEIEAFHAHSREIGISIGDAHTPWLDHDPRWNGKLLLESKARWDPHGLLNPGKLRRDGATAPRMGSLRPEPSHAS